MILDEQENYLLVEQSRELVFIRGQELENTEQFQKRRNPDCIDFTARILLQLLRDLNQQLLCVSCLQILVVPQPHQVHQLQVLIPDFFVGQVQVLALKFRSTHIIEPFLPASKNPTFEHFLLCIRVSKGRLNK